MSDGNSILAANLAAVRRRDAALAQRLEQAEPAPLAWAASKQGPLSAALTEHGKTLQLASRYDPLAEARKIASNVDHGRHACLVVLGLGVAHHVALLANELSDSAVMMVYEPDIALLRAVLEKIDCTAWLKKNNVMLLDAEVDRAALLHRIERLAGTITQGAVLVTHPPTRQRRGEAVAAFSKLVTEALAFCRTNVATALVNASRTCFNQSSNLPWYAAGATVNDLHNAAAGYPAVCVGAGPSLAKNVDLLRDPAVRKRVVVISAQTTLKPLLDRGIRPDFVTALDYSEISRRFYEGLPDLPEVTLVVEPKAHPAIVEAFPGPVRVTQSRFLDRMIGELARPIAPIKEGATVAHLSFYLAQHLGCDPIILIGQDLGFSDGLYYCPGTAIHEVWAGELNAFSTLEMMEWTRIVRHKGHLARMRDIHDRPIFSDEQMVTYLKQFERDFVEASQTIIDATEGGLPKQRTQRMTLAEALAEHAQRDVPALPRASRELDPQRLRAAGELLEARIEEVRELRALSQKTLPLLRQLLEHQRDHARADKLFAKVQQIQKRVHGELGNAFAMVNDLNVVGAFKRARADRAINVKSGDAYTKQAGQLERDIENMNWLIQACDEALRIFGEAEKRVRMYLRTDSVAAKTPCVHAGLQKTEH